MVCDGLIFDMDGTLWDAVDSYAAVWDKTFADLGLSHAKVGREELTRMMGRHLEDIARSLCPGIEDNAVFMRELDRNEREMMPRLGGRLYAGVEETLKVLSKRTGLYIVSNSGECGVSNFLAYTGLGEYFRDTLTHGGTGLTKGENIKLLTERHGLKRALYVGDTRSDAEAARHAGIGMVWAAYGFGTDVEHDYAIGEFSELATLIDGEEQTNEER